MDEHGVEYMLLSLTSPGVQDEADPVKAEKMATVANDYLRRSREESQAFWSAGCAEYA